MTKLFLTFASVAMTFAATAQTKFFVGFEGGFSSSSSKSTLKLGSTTTTTDGNKVTTGSFMPYLGYAVTDNIAVGLGLGVESETIKEPENASGSTSTTKTNFISVSPFVRYSTHLNENFSLWGQLNIAPAFGGSKIETKVGSTTTTTEAKISSLGANIRPGFNYKVADRWIFTGSYGVLGFASTKSKTEETNGDYYETKSTGFGLNLNWNTLRVGFNYLF